MGQSMQRVTSPSASAQCALQAVDAIAREDSLARRRLALRAHALKENLVITHKLLHEQRRVVRQQDSQLGEQCILFCRSCRCLLAA